MYEYTEHAPKKRKSKKGKSLHGMSEEKKTALKQAAVGAGKPLFIVAGLWAGNLIGKLIDKATPPPDPDGKFHFVQLAKPATQIGIGATIAWLSRSKTQDKATVKVVKELAKNLGYGIAGSGLISGAKLLKSDLFEGLGNTGNAERKPVEAKYYTEAKDEIMKMLQDNSFRPALPEGENMNGGSEKREEEMSGMNYSNTEDSEAEIL